MTEGTNGQDGGPPPVLVVAGRLSIYDDTAAGRGHVILFKNDETGQVATPHLPAVVVPLLAKVLTGQEITSDDIPGGLGMIARLRGVFPGG